MVQSRVPNFICPANWIEAFLSSGSKARHGGHHCTQQTQVLDYRAPVADITLRRQSQHRHIDRKVQYLNYWLTTTNFLVPVTSKNSGQQLWTPE